MRTTTFPRRWVCEALLALAALFFGSTGSFARSKPHVQIISLLADPCSEVCAVNLCVVQGAIQECPDMCPANLHLALPANQRVVLKFQDPAHHRRRLRALVRCHGNTRPCFPCRSDVECDDGNACTTDMCVPARIGGCQHIDRF